MVSVDARDQFQVSGTTRCASGVNPSVLASTPVTFQPEERFERVEIHARLP